MERRTRLAQPQDHYRHGRTELPDAADERETAVGPSARLQRDPTAHGAGRLQCRRRPAQPELQAHGATVDGVGGARPFCHEGLPATVHVDRPIPGRPSARTHRAANAKTTAQTLPLVEGAARPGTQTNRAPWSYVGDKVSAILLRGYLLRAVLREATAWALAVHAATRKPRSVPVET